MAPVNGSLASSARSRPTLPPRAGTLRGIDDDAPPTRVVDGDSLSASEPEGVRLSDLGGGSSTVVMQRERAAGAAPLAVNVRVVGTAGSFRLSSGECTVGSGPENDVVINDPTVSRAHLALRLVPEGVYLRDLGSRNGTFYLGQRVESITLGLGAEVLLAGVRVAFEPDREPLGVAPSDETTFRGLLGHSVAMRRVFSMLARLDGSLATVLVTGESGVGKELIAEAIHKGSSVSKGPFVTINCGAVSRELIASELFGHKRGAFTGASDSRKGAFESAKGGTLFLDEIGELPLELQPMLLRALEAGEIRAVGDDQVQRVRARIVTATNRDLLQEVREGRFREDLYYRLAVVSVNVPPLRERPEDIGPMALRFAEAAGLTGLPNAVIEQLKTRPWEGNARELRNAVQSFAALGAVPAPVAPSADVLDAALRELIDPARSYAEQKDELCARFTRLYLESLLAHSSGNQTVAARSAGMDRTYLGRLLQKHGLSRT